MTAKNILTALCLMVATQANAVSLKALKSADFSTREIVRPAVLPMPQSLKIQELLSLPADRFKRRLPEVLQLLQDYEFSKRSIREREIQIREYLRLAVKAINADDTAEADDYIYNAYTEFRSDFDTIMRDISIGRYRNETLTAAEITKLKCNLATMQQARREGNDIGKLPACTTL